MTSDDNVELVLGFPDEKKNDFGRASFPSKIGGKPVFLLDIPAQTPKCARCQLRMRFLCQLYAPVDVKHGEAFHRTLYVFFCGKPSCANLSGAQSVTVLRAQLPRRNTIYSYDGGGDDEVGDVNGDVCAVCGGAAKERCSACKCDSYCDSICQRVDWRLGHKLVCKLRNEGKIEELKLAMNELEEERKNYRFREIAIETEGWSDSESENEEECEVIQNLSGTMQDAGDEELPEELFKGESGEDEVFERFCKLTRRPVDQVVRYMRGGNCVWMHSNGRRQRRENGGEKCRLCGCELVFEFQVLPQAIYFAEERNKKSGSIGEVAKRLRDGLDWGVIAVFTCAQSCVTNGKYVVEQAWLQPNV